MKSLLFFILTFSFVLNSPSPTPHTPPIIDLEKSQIHWTGYKIGGSHSGTIPLKSAELNFEGEEIIGGSFTADMTNLMVTDIKGKKAKMLAKHLKSPDFFDTQQYPSAKFQITQAALQSDGQYKIGGDLTIKNITHSIEFLAQKKGENSLNAQLKIDRSKFNVQYKSSSFFENLGNRMIYDEFELEVQLSIQ